MAKETLQEENARLAREADRADACIWWAFVTVVALGLVGAGTVLWLMVEFSYALHGWLT